MPLSANKGWAGNRPEIGCHGGKPLVSLMAELDELRRAHGDLSGVACGAPRSTVGACGQDRAGLFLRGRERRVAGMVARTDRAIPMLFVGTGKLFAKTHAYRETLVLALQLGDVRVV